jgi:hypothetical protein
MNLTTLRQLAGQANGLAVTFPDSADLDAQRLAIGANAVHLVFVIGSRQAPPQGAVLVDLDGAWLGAVAFFAHNGHIGQGAIPFRVRVYGYGLAPLTVRFTPVAYPGMPLTPQLLEVTATLDLVLSTVD